MTTENAAVEHMAATEEATPRQEEEGDHHDPGPTTTTAFWTALKNKTSSHNPSTEDDYLERLKSYQTALFCAKPACVSPIVCARFGWRCADKDILACRTCGGVTALTTLPSGGLSVSAIHQVYQTYRQQLATSHHMDCPFRFAAEQYLVTKPTSTTTINDNDVIVLPTPFCSVLDPEIVALVEAPFPRRLLEQRLAQLQDELPSRTCLSRQNFVIPPEMETYCGEEEEAQSSESSSILQSLTIQNILGTQDRSLLALALLGWRPRPRPSVMDTTTLSLTCPVCLAGLEIDLTTTTTTSTTTTTTIEEEAPPRATKRIKRPNPLEAHRYYCPIVCGFPTTTPVTTTTTCKTIPFWKVWLSRLDDETSKNNKNQDTTPTGDAIDTNEEEDTTTRTTHRILQVLQMGLTPQKVTL